MNETVEEALQLGLRLTREALQALSRDEWEIVGRLQQTRSEVLQGVSLDGLDDAAAQRLAPILRELVEQDRLLLDAATRGRSAALTDLRRVRQRRSGSARYRAQKPGAALLSGRTIRFS